MLERLNRMTLTWWFGHALLLGLSIAVILAAALLTPSFEAVSFFGSEVPVLCGWRRMTGWPCLGCGLTRSFTFMAHGRVFDAFQVNLLGPLLFALVASQIPWRAVILWRGRPTPPAPPEALPQP